MRALIQRNRGLLIFILCLSFFRTAIADWNPVPSGSMRPTILEGDVVLVNRLAYDFKVPLTDVSLFATGEPQRGVIVTFSSPKDGTRLIKRLVALPGDTVELRGDILSINGVTAHYTDRRLLPEPLARGGETLALHAIEQLPGDEHAVQFLPRVNARRDFGPFVVPQGSYFMLGDNRDDSADSRYIGPVPRNLIIGHAHRLLVSADIKGSWYPRFARFGKSLE